MCTVTFIPVRDKVFLTSNRDEKHWRADALYPGTYEFSSGNILFPKDGDAGGTWVALHNNGNAIVFLNGGMLKHTPKPPYRKSRGLILLDLIDSSTPYNSFIAINLNNIEPFTAIIWDDGHLFECRWDGKQKHTEQIDETQPHIWASVTLYDEKMIRRRKEWFEAWLKKHAEPGQEEIVNFHLFSGDGDGHTNLRMNRDGKVFTVSITSISIGPYSGVLQYHDLKNNKLSSQEILFDKTTVSR
jgi:hypothetical protein